MCVHVAWVCVKPLTFVPSVEQFVEGEAEEDEEELANVAGIGNFGVLDKSTQVDLFGKVVEKPAEADEEEEHLRVTKDDLDHIVDDLSDGALSRGRGRAGLLLLLLACVGSHVALVAWRSRRGAG